MVVHDHHSRQMAVFYIFTIVLVFIVYSSTAAKAASLQKYKNLLEIRHQEYLQTLETFGPDSVKSVLAFDRYLLAYQRYEKARETVVEESLVSPPGTVRTTPGSQSDDDYQDLLDNGPGITSDIKIGNKFLKSGNVRGALDMYKMAFSRVFVSPVKVFFMRTDLFFDRLFGPKPPEDIDIADIIPPPPPPVKLPPPVEPPSDERRVQPPEKEDTSWIGDFKYERIMSDSSFTNVNSMTEREVQDFLAKRGSVLAKPYRGQMPSALIMDACRKHKVSPKVILARLQTEQGLISRKTATQHQLDWALGVGCYDSGDWNEKFKGLGKQIEYAAVTLKKHYNGGQATIGKKGVIAMTIDGTPMRIRNAATYSMYKYCPHKHGNKLFYDVYVGFFALLLFLLMKVILL